MVFLAAVKQYQQTLNLPKTDFPMRANLTEKETALSAVWNRDRLYAQILGKGQGAPKYILHDGPPYANGPIHIGHALNKILKDIVIKSKTMEGYSAPFVPGWDCHGLPIEHQVQKALGAKRLEMSQTAIRQQCREYALKWVAAQKEEFIRLGVFGDWENPYQTLTPQYEAAIIREFGKVVAAGSVYKGLKPVLWCMQDETALAEAEVEYQEHTSPSIYVKFALAGRDDATLFDIFSPIAAADTPIAHTMLGRALSIVIWTTTPWTLVANQAVCLHPNFNYVAVIIGNEAFIVAESLLASFLNAIGRDATEAQVVCTFRGSSIEGWTFQHPWLNRNASVILGEHVTEEGGTGCVHTAPGHGREDYEVGLKYRLSLYAPVDSKGRFTPDVDRFAGQPVFEANRSIIALLQENGALLKETPIVHSYPHCWRCKQPVIFRATEQWFVSMETTRLRERALKEIDCVAWIPKWGKDRIIGAVGNRPDWCISRQRDWGVPIVAFACQGCKTVLLSPEVINAVAAAVEKEGADIWFSKSEKELLPEGTACAHCGGTEFKKEEDILDVWFESGISHAAVLKCRAGLSWPADLYLEGSDQHRGWFQSSLLASLETDQKAPFKAVLTHGFTVDSEGKKMSKSAGNVIAPQEVVGRHGAEILRLWVAATDFRDDIRISEPILRHLVEAYRKIRNTCRFMLGNLYDYPVGTSAAAVVMPIDQWALYRLDLLNRKVRAAYDNMEFHTVFHAFNQFCSVDLSSLYLDILKDRLYTSAAGSPERRSAQAALYEIISTLARLMAPLLSFTAEELWQAIPHPSSERPASVHLAAFPEIQDRFAVPAAFWDRLMVLRAPVSKALEVARQEKIIGAALEAKVTLRASQDDFERLKQQESFLPAFFIVSQVVLQEVVETAVFDVCVEPASGQKCERCWIFSETVGEDAAHPTLCTRCSKVVSAL